MAGPSCGYIMRTVGRSRWTPARLPGGPLSTTATCRSARRPGTVTRSGWTGPRPVSISSMRSAGGGHDVRLAFHLGPHVEAELKDAYGVLGWPGASTPGAARLKLPPQLRWSLHPG
jgi:hypothetical protein